MRARFLVAGVLALMVAPWARAEDIVRSDRANGFAFEPVEARFVRVVLHGSSDGTQPCLDELEVYGADAKRNLALSLTGARAKASSCLAGYAAHAVEHLNDGEYGNAKSWIPRSAEEEWAQIELPEPATVSRVVLSRDRLRQFGDRIPTRFEVLVSRDGHDWSRVLQVEARPVNGSVPGGGGGNGPGLPGAPPPPGRGAGVPADLRAPLTDSLGSPNLALAPGARVTASSVFADGTLPIHQIAHLNDGRLGNSFSWISKGDPSWAEVDLGEAAWVYRVALGNDSSGTYQDRAARSFRVLTATEHAADSADPAWTTALRVNGDALQLRQVFTFAPVRARWVRVCLEPTGAGEARLDELEVYGTGERLALDRIGPLTPQASEGGGMEDYHKWLRWALLGEEHAWLKTFGYADLDPSLVPYNGRVQQYPRHVPDDTVSLPRMSATPVLDGRLDEAAWEGASRGVGRVAAVDDVDRGPLVETAVWCGRRGDDLYLALESDRLLSAHLAVISSRDWEGCGILTWTDQGLRFNVWEQQPSGQFTLARSLPVEGACSDDLRVIELRLPASLFPGVDDLGLRVGVGMGGRHTPAQGRPVYFVPAALAIAQSGPCTNGRFPIRLTRPADAGAVELDLTGLDEPVKLGAGESRVVQVAAPTGPLGPAMQLQVAPADGGAFSLSLLRYDPLQRTLDLGEGMLARLEARGVDAREQAAALRRAAWVHSTLLAKAPDAALEREVYLTARLAKRDLFLRDPDLAAAEKLLFVKRNAFHPSHIYTDYTDAPFRPGGGIYTLQFPRRDGALDVSGPRLTCLFDAGNGVPRDPAANFDLSEVYFGYRPAADGFYHVMGVKPDGTGLRQLTDGPYHDFYPCPLPDGGLAFISTRCTARVFCFRGGSSVLFRMATDGSDIRAISRSSLSEWAPSVMRDGRLIWTRWEYQDKGADFTQTLWSAHPDGSQPDLVFGNDIIQPNGYASGREVPGSSEISCTLVSHFGDINGPIALVDPAKGRTNPAAITSLTPEVPWPGMWPATECFRDPVPLSHDLFLCAHAPADRFGLAVVDRFGNREMLYMDPAIDSVGATLYRPQTPPPAIPSVITPRQDDAEVVLTDVYRGLEGAVTRGMVKWLRVVEEVRHDVSIEPNRDHVDFMKWYASPVDVVSGPYGWPAYIAKAPLGLVPVEEDGSARFRVPEGKSLYFQALDENYTELQRMRSVVQLHAGETRGCVGCHEGRQSANPVKRPLAAAKAAVLPQVPEWGEGPFDYQAVVQPVLDRRCTMCHAHREGGPVDLTGTLDANRVPASYRTLIQQGLIHFVDCGWNSSGCEKREPMTFGTLKSPLWETLNAGHHGVKLTADERLRITTWTDLNCPLWPDYVLRDVRPSRPVPRLTAANGRAG